MSDGFFMWPGVFFPRECVFLRVLQDLNWMFFTASAKGFSHTCSDRTCRMKWLIFPGDRPCCFLHLGPLLVIQNSVVLSCIVILQCLGEVVWGTWSEGARGAPTNTLHPWWIRSVWSADLDSWRQTSFEHAPTRHHRLGKIPQCPAFTLGFLIRKAVEKADHSGRCRGLQETQQWPSVPDGAGQRTTSYLYVPLTGTWPLPSC